MPIRTSRTYQDVVDVFANEKCQLLTTEEEFDDIRNNKTRHPKYRYTASCSHENTTYFHMFMNRKTGVVCPKCKTEKNAVQRKNDLSGNKIQNIEMELDCINYFTELVKNVFIVKKAFDGCKADIIMKPIDSIEDSWIGIQVKTTKKSVRDYGFKINNHYTGCMILCICQSDWKMWSIPYEDIHGKVKVSIGLTKTKYSQYELTNENRIERLKEMYVKMDKKTFDELDTPINIYQQREKDYRKFREEKVDFVVFTPNGMEGMVYDFKIGDKKIQEKVGGLLLDRKNTYMFCLVKNNGGKKNGVCNHIQYDIADNDFYWLNCDNKKIFYVIPEKILIENGWVGNETPKKFLRVNPESSKVNPWLHPYMFDYENLDEDRLTSVLHS